MRASPSATMSLGRDLGRAGNGDPSTVRRVWELLSDRGMETTPYSPLGQPTDRVRRYSPETLNRRVDLLTEASIASVTRSGHDAIVRRVAELDREWDIDRALMLNFAIVGTTFFAAGMRRYARTNWWAPRRNPFFRGVAVQLLFLGLQAVLGWSPPAFLYRRLGFRTKPEIEAERAQLRAALGGKQSGG